MPIEMNVGNTYRLMGIDRNEAGHEVAKNNKVSVDYSELHRPQFHFSPRRNWMNDPNGLIKYKGTYHLYFQYNPKGNQWGNMNWGHALSTDLVHWQEQKVAITEKRHMIFSGTAAVDLDNETLVAAFTSCGHTLDQNGGFKVLVQHQSIAKSADGGQNYQEIPENPVLDVGSTEFRDPKLFYDVRTQKWNMLVSLATEHKIAFYQSGDLLEWKKVSEFGPLGNTDAVWECPDLFELEVTDSDWTKWVLTVSAGHPQQGYLGMQYFVGDFDGTRFIADELAYPLYLDYGKDFYAGITFANTGQKKCATMMAWLGCHLYSKDTPTSPWRGAMSLPRDLFLTGTPKGYRLQTRPPYAYLSALYGRSWSRDSLRLLNDTVGPAFRSRSFVVSFSIKESGATSAGVRVLGSETCETIIGIDFKKGQVFLDRSRSALKVFNKKFPGRDTVCLDAPIHETSLDVFVDHSVIEVFINKGQRTITSLVFPDADGDSIQLYAEGGGALFEKVGIRTVKSIWK